MSRLTWCFALLALLGLSEGANILVVFPFPSKSHNILGEGINRILLNEGHQVTYITGFPKKNKERLTYEAIDTQFLDEINNKMSPFKSIGQTQISLSVMVDFFTTLDRMARTTLNKENIQKLLLDPNQKFDLVIVEWMFSEVYSGLATVFDCPLIWVSSVDPHWQVLRLIDEIPNPAYTQSALSTTAAPPFSFSERVTELLSLLGVHTLSTFLMQRNERATYNDVFGPILEKKGRPLPDYEAMLYNASFMLGNSHVSIGKSIRLPQNYAAVGGYHINPEVEPLPEKWKKIFDNSKHGVIYFSLGSNLKSKDLPDEIRDSLLKMFGSLKYTVIWKFEAEIANLPSNVHIVEWAPQTSILDHPKCKLFITHGGLLSTLESLHFKVPTIGIPVFADQMINVEQSVKRGFALRVDLSYNMADELKVAIEEILGNPKYQQKVEELNRIYHDRPVPPAKELAHWVNHVIQTRGAPHLRSPALLLPWYQKYYLDFYALVFLIVYFIVKIVKFICGLCCSKKRVAEKKSNSKKHN